MKAKQNGSRFIKLVYIMDEAGGEASEKPFLR
jgi:hypothetical protein